MDGGSFEGGVVFLLRMELGPGEHRFHFTANDGSGGRATTEDQFVNVKELPREDDESDPLVIVVPILIICVVVIPVLFLSWIRGRSRRLR
jgi:hypothetical protein